METKAKTASIKNAQIGLLSSPHTKPKTVAPIAVAMASPGKRPSPDGSASPNVAPITNFLQPRKKPNKGTAAASPSNLV